MALIALSDLFKSQTVDQIKAGLLSIASTLGLTTETWHEGDPTRTTMATFATSLAQFTETTALAIAGGLLDYATGGWLTLLARSMGVERIAAASGITPSINFTNASSTPRAFSPSDPIRLANNVTGKTYTTTGSGTIPAGGVLNGQSVTADEVGTGSNANIGEITLIVSPAMAGVTVTNTAALVGTNEELDAALVSRCRDKLGALSPNGPSQAYDFVAKTTKRADGSNVDVNRTRTTSSGTGLVTLTLASSSGDVLEADRVLVQAAVLISALPTGQTVSVVSATELTITVSGTIWVSSKANKTVDQVRSDIALRLTNYFATVPIGGQVKDAPPQGYVFVDAIRSQIFQSILDAGGSTYVIDVDLTSPTIDQAVSTTQVPVLLVSPAFTVTFVTQ